MWEAGSCLVGNAVGEQKTEGEREGEVWGTFRTEVLLLFVETAAAAACLLRGFLGKSPWVPGNPAGKEAFSPPGNFTGQTLCVCVHPFSPIPPAVWNTGACLLVCLPQSCTSVWFGAQKACSSKGIDFPSTEPGGRGKFSMEYFFMGNPMSLASCCSSWGTQETAVKVREISTGEYLPVPLCPRTVLPEPS